MHDTKERPRPKTEIVLRLFRGGKRGTCADDRANPTFMAPDQRSGAGQSGYTWSVNRAPARLRVRPSQDPVGGNSARRTASIRRSNSSIVLLFLIDNRSSGDADWPSKSPSSTSVKYVSSSSGSI